MGLPRSRAREQRGRVCVRWPFQAASAHRVVGICRPASVGALLMRPLPLGTMQNLLQTFERPSDKRRRARHRARHLRRSRLLLMKRWSRWRRRGGRASHRQRSGPPSSRRGRPQRPSRRQRLSTRRRSTELKVLQTKVAKGIEDKCALPFPVACEHIPTRAPVN